MSACMVCDGVSGAGGGGGGEDERAVVGSGSPRPHRRQHRGGTPVPTPSEASDRSQQRGCAASGGEGYGPSWRLRRRWAAGIQFRLWAIRQVSR